MIWFRQHFFLCTLIAFLSFAVAVSYVRFMVLHDYVVAYEGDCDPYAESCFIGCEDDECTEQYYYSSIQKYAPNVQAQCGTDITDCDAAYTCLSEDGSDCEISYCDPVIDGEDACETLTEVDMPEEEAEENSGMKRDLDVENEEGALEPAEEGEISEDGKETATEVIAD